MILKQRLSFEKKLVPMILEDLVVSAPHLPREILRRWGRGSPGLELSRGPKVDSAK